ncbi:hypothetical protein BBF96_05355 [Anoxybacter fermentans]|uniref:Metalloprotease TldD/E C-terminal domain-containing protein n=1 Tax=Anoxybacter fermentans TaxID=1323375 RepID=A0A3Q9HPQ0_9FIRM|nr:metallopeptidase TldD-related protein [Anoxybacter fermentans]AZR72866.1 hypothetical protein BBF96_05355 [Anoxybacter fermentans]
MLNKERIYEIIDFVIKEAEGYNTQVLVFSNEMGLTRFAKSEIHQNVFEDKTEVIITILEGKKQSQIATTLYDKEGLRAAVKEAINNLKFLPEGEVELSLVSSPKLIEDEDFNKELDTVFNIEGRARLIKQGINLLEPGYKTYGALSYGIMNVAYGNSIGIKRFMKGNNVEFNVLVSNEKGGTGYAQLISNRPGDLDIIGAFKIAYEKAKMNRNPMRIKPGPYTVILEPLAVGDLLTYMAYIGFSGKSVQDHRSFLTGKKGEKIFDERITIVDDFTDENTLTLPFDTEGYPRQKVTIIENGIVKDLVYDQASAIKDGVKSTGHSINMFEIGGMPLNLVMLAGDQSLEEIIKSTENGLLITRFHYMNVVNPRQAILTALTRDGVFKIENGKIVGAVENMRFTESMFEAFNNVIAISRERQRTKAFIGNYYVPALKIKNFHFTGNTNV